MLAATHLHDQPRWRWLVLLAAGLFVALAWHGPIAQWADYHAFADARPWLGIPNAANVLSNLPFAAIGAWGLWQLLRARGPGSDARGDLPWLLFCAALICTAAGSAFYHWAPDNGRLATDRLPIAWACAVLMCGFLADHAHPRWAGTAALACGVGVASLSVGYWWWTERTGLGDLRAYLYVQFLPMLLVPAALWLHLPTRRVDAIADRAWWLVLWLYAAAKALEMADRWLLDATRLASGHMLKHLLAAMSAGVLVAAVVRRTRAATRSIPGV